MKPVIAFIYDFDGTLSPRNMQEYDFLPHVGLEPGEFWAEANKRAVDNNADTILAYMTLMLEKCSGSQCVQLTREKFAAYGKNIDFFPGVEDWFGLINSYVISHGFIPQHYVLSSGVKEMIAGSAIAHNFEDIFACSYIYDEKGVAIAPGVSINYTGKTQFLFRINKGVHNVWDNSIINDYVPKEERPVPFTRMIYFGDGFTDVPCMKLVKDQGGHSISVYKPGKGKDEACRLFRESRVNFTATADYRPGSELDTIVKAIVNKIVSDTTLNHLIPTY
ncbi:MAG: haloacid dehalogenase-like hydrolase [Candidatus Cloacimonetes bacterium]|nr:haloacid dehalogenase-like hydrolase [Candidatus Cloacimonadota bacterium]